MNPEILHGEYNSIVPILQKNTLVHGAISPHIPTFNGSFLWDTALIAEGVRHYDPYAAAQQIESHLLGTHTNGMIPNETIVGSKPYAATHLLEYQNVQHDVIASRITQPPTIISAAWHVAQSLPKDERRAFLNRVYPTLHNHMRWLLAERTDPTDGLPMLVHPHESGMDDSPNWNEVLQREWTRERMNAKESLLYLAATALLPLLRTKDTERHTRADNTHVSLAYLQSRLVTSHVSPLKMLAYGKGTVVKDVGFSVLTAEAGRDLIAMHSVLHANGVEFDANLYESLGNLEQAIESVHYNPNTQKYQSIDVRSGDYLPAESASSLLPLLTVRDSTKRDALIAQIIDPEMYWTNLPIPSVPAHSANFDPYKYWQGGSWSFIRYQIENALRRTGEAEIARELRYKVLHNQEAAAYGEFNNPITGTALGVNPFSPAAAEQLLYRAIDAKN